MAKKVFTDESFVTFVDNIKLYTDSQIEDLSGAVAYIDDEDNENVVDDNPTANVVVDSALSTTSTNPVQNKVITNKFNELSNEIDDIGKINSVTGASVTVKDAIAGKVISCVGESEVTVSGYNICSVKELSGVGHTSAKFGEKLPAGNYTLIAECTTNNPDIEYVKVNIGGFQKNFTCDGQRYSQTFNITREVDASIGVFASNTTSPLTEYSVALSNIVITTDSSKREYEPYFEPVTYNVDKLNEIKLTEYTNIITSDSEFALRYIHRNDYVKSLLSSIDTGAKIYVTPEDFGAYGDGLADDTNALNECVTHGISNNIPIRGYGRYKTSEPINVIGNYVNLYIYQIDYLGDDNAVVYQGSNSFITIQTINSNGNGLFVIADTENVFYNTFTINTIIAQKNGVYIYAKKNNYQNKLNFNLIRSNGEYACILFGREEEKDPSLTEWIIRGGLVTGGLWGVRGFLKIADSIHIHAENLGSSGNGGAIYSENGEIPRIYYCRNAELVQINSFLKIGGIFFCPQTAEICKTMVPLESIDITEVEVDYTLQDSSWTDNIQTLTEIEVQKDVRSNILLTKHLILWGNRFQFPPVRYIRFDVNSDIDMTPQYYNEEIPQCFVAKADATINLHPTYAANCLNTFEIVQEEGHKLIVKDFVGNVIFDGTQYADGRYRLTAYVGENIPLKYDMSNQMWEILEL